MNGREARVAAFAAAGIALHLLMRFALHAPAPWPPFPLYAVLIAGGLPLGWDLLMKLRSGEGGADLLAALSIVVAIVMGEPMVGSILILMLSGGAALERFASRRASAVLQALAKRMPRLAHRRNGTAMEDVGLDALAVGDLIVVFPHEVAPVDGVVIEGHGAMDEAYLTGEPFGISKAPGSAVLSGAVNGEAALVVRAEKLPADSRYAKIVRVMEAAERDRPRLRRLGDRLAAWYAPLAVCAALGAWLVSGDPSRFLAVLVVATPCPLLIAIPVAVIGAISLSAERGIIIKNPSVLELIAECRTVIFDKTGTLTSGEPTLTGVTCAPGFGRDEVLRLAAALEQYSRHPLASAIVKAAGAAPPPAGEIGETPGQGLRGTVDGRAVWISGRDKAGARAERLPPPAEGLECLVFVDERFAAAFSFHDVPRPDSRNFLTHLPGLHSVTKVMLVSGDREASVRYLARTLGIDVVRAGVNPEGKVAIVAAETRLAKTLFVGDGINDAPALRTATVGVAFGPNNDVSSEAADAVILSPSIAKIDELIHIGERMRSIALQSAVGGMALSVIGMAAAAGGLLSPVQGAVVQELIDLAAVLNAVRAAWPPARLTDY
ncbi:MAG: heavy metal translocating P-type ATPase [Elusimicrobiota bacterium]